LALKSVLFVSFHTLKLFSVISVSTQFAILSYDVVLEVVEYCLEISVLHLLLILDLFMVFKLISFLLGKFLLIDHLKTVGGALAELVLILYFV
jgi:hypothetical protein